VTRAPVVLIVSEHEWASRSLDTILAPQGYAVMRAYNGKQAIERCGGTGPDAVFIDRRLPDTDGQDLCRSLLDRDLVTRSTPILLMTATPVSRDERLGALRAGAWEVLTLPLDAEELLLRIDRYVRAKQESDRARDEALLDPATGFYSWDGIVRRVRELGAAAERFGRPLACVVFAANDSEAEDLPTQLGIAQVAEMLRGATRRSDVLARIGPREFAVIAPDTSPEGAQILAERLRQRAGGLSGDNGGRQIRAGVYAIRNLRDTGLDPMELVVRATLASRDPAAAADLN
jgi:two-component system, cell cycle response regulator